MPLGGTAGCSADLEARGISIDRVEAVGEAGRKATLTDPDGNSVALIQVAAG